MFDVDYKRRGCAAPFQALPADCGWRRRAKGVRSGVDGAEESEQAAEMVHAGLLRQPALPFCAQGHHGRETAHRGAHGKKMRRNYNGTGFGDIWIINDLK